MTDYTDLIAKLRRHAEDCPPTALEIAAADALEAQARENAMLEFERDLSRK